MIPTYKDCVEKKIKKKMKLLMYKKLNVQNNNNMNGRNNNKIIQQ